MKPGNETSEYKVTLIMGVVSAVLTLLVGFDVISVEDRQRAETMLVTLLPLLLPTVAYILGRVLLKLKG
jgi:ABC-type uncharacterized transport system YnjBCD permease subunit